VKEFLEEHRPIVPLLYLIVIAGVIWAGMLKNHRRLASRISSHLARYAQATEAETHTQPDEGGPAMTRMLVPVDASDNARRAVRHVIAEFMKKPAMEIHLLNIQPALSRHVAQFVSRRNRAAFHREQGEKALAPARRLLAEAGVPHTVHIEIGDRAQVIAREARRLRCDRIIMATARKNSLTRMLEDSVTNEVLELATVPVEVIAGDAVSKWERYGIPAGIGVAFALVYAAVD
jgi:nucleotide-binding universal stress UspA family protein